MTSFCMPHHETAYLDHELEVEVAVQADGGQRGEAVGVVSERHSVVGHFRLQYRNVKTYDNYMQHFMPTSVHIAQD